MSGFSINIVYRDEDRGYIADIPDLLHCSAFGDTPEKALAEVLIAKDAWMEVARSEGREIPPPHFRPLIYQSGPVHA